MKKRSKLRLNRETLGTLGLEAVGRVAGGATFCCELEDTCLCPDIPPGPGGGTGGGITVSVPFCATIYPNTCASIGTC